MGITAAIIIPRISNQAFDAKKKCCCQYAADINSAIERYRFDQGAFPSSLSVLEGDYYPDVLPKCPVNNLDYTMDPVLFRVIGHQH